MNGIRIVVSRLVRCIAIGTLSGFVAGVIAGGFGSRIAMRISAIAAGPEMQGRITEAGNVVGEITLTGTVFLSLAAGFFGIYGGLLYVAVKRWIPGSWLWKGLMFGLLLLLMIGYVVIDGDNFDFYVFGPAPLNITMFASIFIFYGLVVAALAERLDRLPSTPSFSFARIPANAVLTFGGVFAYAFWVMVGASSVVYLRMPGPLRDFQNTPSDPFPPHPVQFLYTLAMIAVGYVLLALAARKESDVPWAHRKWRVVGYPIIAIPALTGLVYIIEEITKILERAG